MPKFYKFFIILLLFLHSCAGSVKTSIDTYSASVPLDKTYIIKPADKNVSDQDLQFMAYAKILQTALSSRGYKVERKNPKQIIFINYGLGQMHEQTNVSTMPQYGITGYTNVGGYARANYGIKGYTTTVTSVKKYPAYLQLISVDYKLYQRGKIKQYWKINSQLTSKVNDLREILPYMVMQDLKYIGNNKQFNITFESDDPQTCALFPYLEDCQ